MTTTALRPSAVPAQARLSFGGLVRSEWIKLRSLRSTGWSYAIMILASGGMAGLMTLSVPLDSVGSLPLEGGASVDATVMAMALVVGLQISQLIICVLGVLVITGEYSTGMIRTTFTAAPRRLGAYSAKALVLFIVTFLVALITSAFSYLVAALVMFSRGRTAPLFEPEILGPVFGGALFLACVAVFALGIGTVLRSGAGGIAASMGLLLVLPIVLSLIPLEWVSEMQPYLLYMLGMTLTGMSGQAISTATALIGTGIWALAALLLGAILLRRRDV